MKDYSEQIHSIKQKLIQAKQVDVDFKVFGASSHKYEINPPASINEVEAFEKRYSVQLPDCYRAFVLQVGNGGTSYMNSGAGPFYGIYTLGEHLGQMVDGNPQSYLNNESPLFPNLSNEDWDSMSKVLADDNISDEDYYKELEKIYSGILPIGLQGCTYLHGLVLNGTHKGKVVNLELSGDYKPIFANDKNFLAWYERWLDEVISGKLISNSPSWFGYAPPK